MRYAVPPRLLLDAAWRLGPRPVLLAAWHRGPGLALARRALAEVPPPSGPFLPAAGPPAPPLPAAHRASV
ncbi:hypothetical protein E2C05_31335, partial [Paracraurococcus ruber]|uniref:hypothetical protein n=1 Tax=Paracraurococcus ruber TaxID=77675 RepID=UPI001960BD17